MTQLTAAIVKEQNVTFAVAIMKDHVLNSPSTSDRQIQAVASALRCPLVVLMDKSKTARQSERCCGFCIKGSPISLTVENVSYLGIVSSSNASASKRTFLHWVRSSDAIGTWTRSLNPTQSTSPSEFSIFNSMRPSFIQLAHPQGDYDWPIIEATCSSAVAA
jgi:hypothetical protein